MKKTMAFILAICLCAGLCACGNGSNQDTVSINQNPPITDGVEVTTRAPQFPTDEPISTLDDVPTETPQSSTDEQKKKEQYDYALMLLSKSSNNYHNRSGLVKEAHDILLKLGDYQESKGYLAKISIVDNVLLEQQHLKYDYFGQITQDESIFYGYWPSGLLHWENASNENNSVNSITVMEYDDFGNTVKSQWLNSDGSVSSEAITEYELDETGKILSIKIIRYENSKITFTEHCAYKYDANGNLIKITNNYINESGPSNSFTEYEYNDENLLLSEISENIKTEYEYDNRGLLIKVERTNTASDTRVELQTYTYDEFGNKLQIITHLANYGKYVTDFKNNNITCVTAYNYDNSLRYQRFYEYNGDLLISEKSSENETVYAYDEHGNKISCVITTNDGVLVRKLNYVYGKYYFYNAVTT